MLLTTAQPALCITKKPQLNPHPKSLVREIIQTVDKDKLPCPNTYVREQIRVSNNPLFI